MTQPYQNGAFGTTANERVGSPSRGGRGASGFRQQEEFSYQDSSTGISANVGGAHSNVEYGSSRSQGQSRREGLQPLSELNMPPAGQQISNRDIENIARGNLRGEVGFNQAEQKVAIREGFLDRSSEVKSVIELHSALGNVELENKDGFMIISGEGAEKVYDEILSLSKEQVRSEINLRIRDNQQTSTSYGSASSSSPSAEGSGINNRLEESFADVVESDGKRSISGNDVEIKRNEGRERVAKKRGTVDEIIDIAERFGFRFGPSEERQRTSSGERSSNPRDYKNGEFN